MCVCMCFLLAGRGHARGAMALWHSAQMECATQLCNISLCMCILTGRERGYMGCLGQGISHGLEPACCKRDGMHAVRDATSCDQYQLY